MSLTAAAIGRIGEALLAKWGSQANMTPNPSRYDTHGWDYLLQFNADAPKGHAPLALDLMPPEMSCMIQVKTTSSEKRAEPITLNNWARMAKEAIPWFVLVIRLDQNAEPETAFLVHIGEQWCGQVLRRLRQLGALGAQLGARTMNVVWADGDALPELHGRALASAIRRSIGNQREYVAEKLRWFEDLGYTDKRRSIDLSFAVDEPAAFWEVMAQVAVGKRQALPRPWHAAVSDTRFGVAANVAKFNSEASTDDIELGVTSLGTARVSVFSGEHEQAQFDCDVFKASAAFPFLPREFDRIRFSAEGFEMEIPARSGAPSSLRFTIPLASPTPVRRLRAISLGLAAHISGSVRIRIAGPGGPPITTVSEAETLSPEALRAAARLAQAVSILGAFGVDDRVEVNLGEVFTQSDVLTWLPVFLGDTVGPVNAPHREPVPLGSLPRWTPQIRP